MDKKGIRTTNLKVGYGKKLVVDGIDIEVLPGCVLALIGPNGAGKSTVLKSITNQLKTLGGKIYINDEDMSSLREMDIAKKVSIVMTKRPSAELMSCRDVVATGRYPYTGRLGTLSKADWDFVDESMAMAGVAAIADQSFDEISDGQKQRVMLARALCQDTDVIVLDEPTSYLDIRYKLEILECIRNIAKKKNKAVVMSLHELELVPKIADMVVCISGEKVEKVASPQEIFSGDFISRLYGLEKYNFDNVTGRMELSANKGAPKVFVIGGAGTGMAAYYYLYREQIPFAAGILWENDTEYFTAKSLSVETVSQKAFVPVTDELIAVAKKLIDSVDYCICEITEFGPLNGYNQELMEYARSKGKLKIGFDSES